MPFKPVDAAIKVIVGPAIDDTDFKTREELIAFNQAGMEVDVILEKHDGTIVTTAVTPTAAGDYDWAHTDQGYYELELPASGGASFNNTEEGIITVAVFCTGVLPFRSVSYDVVPALVYASMVKGTDALQVDAIQISGDATAANNAELAFDGTGFGFTGCTMPTVSTLTGHTAQTGDSFARIGAPIGASISADLVVIDNFVDNLETRLTAARAGYLDNLSAGAVALAATALTNATWTDAKAGFIDHSITTIDTNVDTLLTRITAARAGYLDELAAANIPADIDTLLTRISAARAGYLDNLSAGAVALASTALTNITWTDAKAAFLNHSISTIDTNVDTLLTRLTAARAGYLDELAAANIPADIDTLITNVPDIISLANIRTQADNALIAINLDHLMKIAVDTNWATTVHLDSALGHMVDVGGAATFDRTADSNEAIRNRGDAAWTTGAGGTVPSLLQNTTIATLATQVSFTLTAGSVDDNAYNGAIIVITDAVSGVQKAVGRISDYTGASKTITLKEDPAIFTMAVGDTVDIIATDKLFIEYTAARAGYLDELAAANLPADIDNIWITVSSIFTQVGIDGAGLTNMPWNGSWDAEVQSEVDDALVAFFTSAAELVDNIWDEILTGATHNIATSAGRRVRELGAYHITSGTAQGGATHSITLAAADTAADHIYNRNLIVILAGTGVGQTRTIVDFANGTKVAVVDRNWWITPDATSEYTIIPDDTPLVTDHGVATAGTNNTITIRASASAISSTYSNDIILIMAGTGIGQSRLISTYNGGTNVVTVCENWTTNPDNTSVYVILPYGHAHVCAIGTAPLADIRTQADDALSAVHLNDLIQLALTVNDGAPNAADFVTSSAVAVDDWYNENMLLFTSGALAGLARFIDDYDGGTKRIYLTEAFPQAPANTDDFVIVGVSGSAPAAADIADAVWDELEAGHTIADSFGEEVTKQGKKLDRNLILDL